MREPNQISGYSRLGAANTNMTHELIVSAYNYADIIAPDGGPRWLPAFDSFMRELGASNEPPASCACLDGGERGHAPECGWYSAADLAVRSLSAEVVK